MWPMTGVPDREGGTWKRQRPSSEQPPASPEQSRWGLGDAVVGFVVGFVLANVAVAVWVDAAHVRTVRGVPVETFGVVLASLLGLWAGLAGAPLVATRRKGSGRLSADFGLSLRPWPDIPVGIVVGLCSQYLLVPVLYLPLRPFVTDINQRLGQPAQQITSSGTGAAFVIVALLVCVGSPVIEELFFRGLVLRSLERRLAGLGTFLGGGLSVLITAVLFGLAHDESLQLLGLVGLGVVLGVMARRYGRLGPGIVAHATFNTAAVISIALSR